MCESLNSVHEFLLTRLASIQPYPIQLANNRLHLETVKDSIPVPVNIAQAMVRIILMRWQQAMKYVRRVENLGYSTTVLGLYGDSKPHHDLRTREFTERRETL
jgi:hypothetical protein